MLRCCAPTMAQCGSGCSRERIVRTPWRAAGAPAEIIAALDTEDVPGDLIHHWEMITLIDLKGFCQSTNPFICKDLYLDAICGFNAAVGALTHMELLILFQILF